MLVKPILRTASMLALFAVVGTAGVAYIFANAHVRIEQNEKEALLQKLSVLVPPAQYDNNLLADATEVTAKEQLGTSKPVTIYRARQKGQPVAAVFSPVVAPDGYSGAITLLIAVHYDGSLAGVRVISHHETPGLGDPIDESRSNWIFSFDKRFLGKPDAKDWKVKKDGGVFDQFTGATITPRAVVKAVYNCLTYYAANRDTIFTSPAVVKKATPG